MTNFKRKFSETVKEYSMICEGESVLCGLSGGADSVSLLTALCSLKEDLKISRIVAVHINHCLRDTADRDENFSKNLCEKLGVEFFSVKSDVAKIAREKGLSEEEAGRNVRYEAFFKYKNELKIDKIATAHTKDDVAETFLIRLLRGSSLDGLYGIKFVREDGVVRPLIKFTKNELIDFLKANNQDYVTDETNLKDDYLRNHIRLNLIPYLKENYNPEITNDIYRTSQLFSRDAEYIAKNTEKAFEKIVKREKDSFLINISEFSELDYSISSRIINKCFKLLCGSNLYYVHISDIFEMLKKGETGKRLDLPKNIVAETVYGTLVICRKKEAEEYYCPLKIGAVYIKEADKTVVVAKGFDNNKNAFNIEAGKLHKYAVRSFAAGDRIKIKNVGTKKIKDIFIDKKIPRYDRAVFPVITCDNEPVWLWKLYKNEQTDIENPLNIKIYEGDVK